MRAKRLMLAMLAAPALLTGCSEDNALVTSAGPVTGAAAAIGLGAVTANPFIAYAAGVGTQAAVNSLQQYFSREIHQGEQDNIALAVGRMQPGQEAAWQIRFDLPIGDAQGDVSVTRVITSALTTCKEAAFTVITSKNPQAPRPVYITTACQEPDGGWKWAEAEPATQRWGFLQ
jgi:hypothetical protein